MTYLILQILFCLLIAFLFGLLVGWLLGKSSAPTQQINAPEQPVKTNFAPPPPPAPAPIAKASPPPVVPSVNSTTEKKKKPAAAVNLDTSVTLDGKGYEIETLEGVGPKTGTALREIGISTIGDFLKNAYSASQRADIATQIAVRPKMVDSWASMSDLLRIKGVDHQAAELMHKSGIKTVSDLAEQNATTFIAKMESTNTAGKRSIAPEVPSSSSVTDWTVQAARLKPVIEI